MAARNASTLPSPPSATGMETTSASGTWRRRASRISWQISREDMVPLKESGMRIHFDMSFLLSGCAGRAEGPPRSGHGLTTLMGAP